MKKIAITTIVIIALVSSAFTINMLWKADDKNSTVNFELPGGDKKGTFANLTSSINFDKTNLKDSKISATIDVKTLKAGDDKLDAHLLSSDFFNAEKFPKITFTSNEITSSATGFVAKGTLTMKDSTKIIDLPFTFTEKEKNKAVFTGTITVMAGDYGVMKQSKGGSDKVIVYLVVPVTK